MLEYFKFTLSSYGEGYIETEVFLKGNPLLWGQSLKTLKEVLRINKLITSIQ